MINGISSLGLTNEAHSIFTGVLDGALSPTGQSHILSMDTNSSASWIWSFPPGTIDLILIEQQQQQPHDSVEPPELMSPGDILAGLQSPSTSESLVVTANNVPANSAGMKHTNNIEKTRPPCLSDHTLFATIAPVSSVSRVPNLNEAQRALDVVMQYFKDQPPGLHESESIVLGRLMEKLGPANDHTRTSKAPAELSRLDSVNIPHG